MQSFKKRVLAETSVPVDWPIVVQCTSSPLQRTPPATSLGQEPCMGTLGAQVLTVDALGAQVLGFGSKLGSKFGLPMKKHISIAGT